MADIATAGTAGQAIPVSALLAGLTADLLGEAVVAGGSHRLFESGKRVLLLAARPFLLCHLFTDKLVLTA